MKNKIKLLGFIFLFVTLLSITGLTVYATGENNQFEINPDTYGTSIEIKKVWDDNEKGKRPTKIDINYKVTYKEHVYGETEEHEQNGTVSLTEADGWKSIIRAPGRIPDRPQDMKLIIADYVL